MVSSAYAWIVTVTAAYHTKYVDRAISLFDFAHSLHVLFIFMAVHILLDFSA